MLGAAFRIIPQRLERSGQRFMLVNGLRLLVSFAKTLADRETNNIAAAVSLAFCYNSWPWFDSWASASERWFASFARDEGAWVACPRPAWKNSSGQIPASSWYINVYLDSS